jgi:TorA maturation chaperone TorD
MSVQELTETLKGRDVLFNLFSQVFIDIPDEFTDKLMMDTAALVSVIAGASNNSDFSEGAAVLRKYFDEAGSLEETRQDRTAAFTSLFLLGKASSPVYESVHRSPEKMVKQDPWSQVKEFYMQNGFRRSEKRNIMEDHVSIELQFMGLLSAKAAEACEAEDFEACSEILAAQLKFYDEHIMKWVPKFCSKVAEKKDEHKYAVYAAYALILKGFLVEDTVFLRELLED